MAMSDPWPGLVRIRAVEDPDLAVFFQHQIDPEATRMAAFPARELDAFMAHWAKIRTDQTVFAQTIVVGGNADPQVKGRADQHVAGYVVSWEKSGQHEVGYWIGRDLWGHGIASKALTLFLERMPVRPLHAYVAVGNIGSMKVLERCGFQRVEEPEVQSSTADDDATDDFGVEHVVFALTS